MCYVNEHSSKEHEFTCDCMWSGCEPQNNKHCARARRSLEEGDGGSSPALPDQLQSFLLSLWRKGRVCLKQWLQVPTPLLVRSPSTQEGWYFQIAGSKSEINGCSSKEEVEGRSGVKESVLQLPRCQAEGNISGVILWPKSPPEQAGGVSQNQCQTEPRPQSSAEGKEGITQQSKENQVRKITPFFM